VFPVRVFECEHDTSWTTQGSRALCDECGYEDAEEYRAFMEREKKRMMRAQRVSSTPVVATGRRRRYKPALDATTRPDQRLAAEEAFESFVRSKGC
jgi:hypothetical protein